MAVRWGIVGCGDIARKRVARAILDDPNSRLLAACRRDPGKLRDFCQVFGVERSYTRADELVNDPDIDAVYIATPVYLHLPQALATAETGKHVLVEKPMARTIAECDQIIEVCRAYGVKLGVAYYRRFYPIVARMKALLAAGEIGQPLSIAATASSAFALGPRDDGYWRASPDQGGGGVLMDIGSHRLNLFLYFFGAVADVRAYCDTPVAEYEAEQCATVLLRFQAGLHGSLQCFFGTTVPVDEFSILGTKGRLAASPLNGGQLRIDLGRKQRMESHPPAENLHAPLISDFVSAILDNREPRVSGEEGRQTNEIIERAYRSAERQLGLATFATQPG